MRLMEEPVRQQAPFTSCESAVKALRHERLMIRLKTAMFLRKGGKIDCGKPTHNTLEMPAYESDLQRTIKAKKRDRAQRSVASRVFVQSPISYMDGANRTTKRAASGHQNITVKTLRDGRKSYSVVVGSTRVGTFYDETTALTERDKYRKANGLDKVLY